MRTLYDIITGTIIRLAGGLVIGLMCAIPVAILTGAGFWNSALAVMVLFAIFGPTS